MIIELIGWIGVIFVLLAYFLVTVKKVASTSKEFHLLNLLGALGIMANSFYHGAIPNTGLNIVWSAIAIWGLWNAVKKE